MSNIEPIAYIYNEFKDKFGIPRQPGRVNDIKSEIVFVPKYRDESSLRGIRGFNYIWLIFDFSLSHRDKWSPTVRPPRLGGNKRIGVFASRSPYRPNNLGLSSVKLEAVEKSEKKGTYLVVSGADILDGTPIYDIKPYLPSSDCHIDAEGGYADEFTYHKLTVEDPEGIFSGVDEKLRCELFELVADDPRPAYQNDSGRPYSIRYGEYEINFRVDGDKAIIVKENDR